LIERNIAIRRKERQKDIRKKRGAIFPRVEKKRWVFSSKQKRKKKTFQGEGTRKRR